MISVVGSPAPRFLFFVMAGLDPAIHEARLQKILRRLLKAVTELDIL